MTGGTGHPVYDAALAYQTTAALVAAVKLDVFSLIGSGASTVDRLSTQTGASVRGLRILCDYLTVIGFLSKEGSFYRLEPAARRYLDSASQASMASAVDFFAAPEMVALLMDDPAEYVRNGGAVGLGSVSPEHPVWVRFARAVVPFASPTAKRVAAYLRTLAQAPSNVLDVAAGHGLYGIEVARACPGAHVTALDWETVLRVAQSNATAAQVTDRYRTLAGSAFESDWGQGRDLVLLPNFLHHFSRDDCVILLRKARESLSPTGQALIIDFIPNEDRISPPLQAKFAFWMLATTPAGDAYTLKDYEAMALEAGFGRVSMRQLLPTPQTLVILER